MATNKYEAPREISYFPVADDYFQLTKNIIKTSSFMSAEYYVIESRICILHQSKGNKGSIVYCFLATLYGICLSMKDPLN